MVCSYWRSALVVLVGWAGLAWAQTPSPAGPEAAGPAERIMVVHENGASIRCRIVHTWILPDGRTAHQLQALETGEMITIVDDAPEAGAPSGGLRGLPKRIFHWGRLSRTAPAGAPVAPDLAEHLATPSGVVIHQDVPPPGGFPRGPVVMEGGNGPTHGLPGAPIIMEGTPGGSVVMNGPHGGQVITNGNPNGPIIMEGSEVIQSHEAGAAKGRGLFNRLLAGRESSSVTGPTPLNIHEHPLPPSEVVIGPDGRPLPPSAGGFGGNLPMTSGAPTQAAPTLRERVANLFQGGASKSSRGPMNGAPNSPSPYSTSMGGSPNTGKPAPRPLAIAAPPSQAKNVTLDPGKGGNLFNRPSSSGAVASVDPKRMGPDNLFNRPGSGGSGATMDPKKVKSSKTQFVHLPPPLTNKKKDCLCDPEKFNPSTKHLKKNVPAQTCKAPGCATPCASAPGGVCAPAKGCWPLGAQSVLAATGGAPTQVVYVPVPMKSVPYPVRPPDPPPPAIPQPPQANLYCNGFCPPMAQAGPPAPPPWQLAGAFSGPMQQAAGWNPYTAMQAQYMYAQMQQAALWQAYYRSMLPVNPYATRQPASAPQTMNYPRNYPGPQAPNPFSTRSAQTGPMPMPALPMLGAGYAQASIEQLLRTLREAPLPSERELAALALAQRNPQVYPQLVPALLQAAQHDPAPSVRAGCVHCVARLGGIDRGAVQTALHTLRRDADPHVRGEVEQALARLGTATK